jgi:hypothetical protein
MTGCGGETLIEREEGGFEALGERHVSSVVCREVFPESPDSQEQDVVLMAHEAKVSEVVERQARTLGAEGAGRDISAKGLHDFEVQEVRHVE